MTDSHAPEHSGGRGSRTDLTLDDFARFFNDVHGQEPFPWQLRLTEQVLGGRWPEVIDLPTGTGKTAALDVAVFAMAARPDVSPRRIVFVIDRRVVVNQVHVRAERIRDRILHGDTDTLRAVRERLQDLTDGEPLGVAALQGGVPIDREWAKRPDQPWVIVSTVDQFGSRLLFRGYGVSRSMRPVYAGLAGNDCLVILDEVHLSVPFSQTLARVAGMGRKRIDRRFGVVEMSATPGNAGADRFKLDRAEDLDGCAEMRRRVTAKKEAELHTVKDREAIPSAVLDTVRAIARTREDDHIGSVGVVVNTVRAARETHRALKDAGHEVYLITGRMRPLDRVQIMEDVKAVVDPDARKERGGLDIVVATQAIEVGADINFDALITECAAADSLRQRFGRLDRRGQHYAETGRPSKAWIIGPRSVVKTKKPDFIYGNSARATWAELAARASNGRVDVGPLALGKFPPEAEAPRPEAPLLLRSYMDAWSQTNPEPAAQPPVEWFLHGIQTRRAPDVSIVWRSDRSDEVLGLVPPRQAEALQVPINAAKSWLSAGGEVDVADAYQDEPQANEGPGQGARTDFAVWRGGKPATPDISADDIRAGDVIVVAPARGGLTDGTWDPSSDAPVPDMGDRAQHAHRGRLTLRLDAAMAAESNAKPPKPKDQIESDRPIGEDIRRWLGQVAADDDGSPEWLSGVAERLLSDGFDYTRVDAGGNAEGDVDAGSYYVLIGRSGETRKPAVDVTAMDGSDRACSMIGTAVTLDRHLDGVGELAERTASRLGLSGFAADLRLAGRLHDIGKVDMRFQKRLTGGDPVYSVMHKEPLAKSLPGAPRGPGSYPLGMRHEAASAAMLASNADILASSNDGDLVLHLVASHHGWGRPLLPIVEDADPQNISYTFGGHVLEATTDVAKTGLALEMSDTFWRLTERYGHYGLAWLEAILRLADHRRSAEEAR